MSVCVCVGTEDDGGRCEREQCCDYFSLFLILWENLYVLFCEFSVTRQGQKPVRNCHWTTSTFWNRETWSPQGTRVDWDAPFHFLSSPNSSLPHQHGPPLDGFRRLRWYICSASLLSVPSWLPQRAMWLEMDLATWRVIRSSIWVVKQDFDFLMNSHSWVTLLYIQD